MKLLLPKYFMVFFMCCLAGIGASHAQQILTDTTIYPPPRLMDTAISPSPLIHVPDTGTVQPAKSAVAPDTTGPPFSLGNPQQYVVSGIRVTGSQYLDPSLVASVTGIYKGEKITLPGDALADAIHKLWDQRLFANIDILIDKIEGNKIFLNIRVTERPRLANYYFQGIKKTAATELKDKVGLIQGSVITGNTILSAIDKIKAYFVKKGYNNVAIKVTQNPSKQLLNTADLIFHVDKGHKVKVDQIYITGNEYISDRAIKKKMKGTNERTRFSLYPAKDINVYGPEHRLSLHDYLKNWGFLSFTKTRRLLDPYVRFKFFSSSKFNKTKYEEDKDKVLSYYNSLGYRDVVINADTVYGSPGGGVDVALKVTEGTKYYFGDITWKGNTQYADSVLAKILGIQTGDVYNLELLDKRLGLTPTQEGGDISTLYQDNGYLFYRITPVETAIHGDTIDYEMRMVEGPQADINKVPITGNTKTNEHVARRELRTIPGNKYSKSDIMRSMRQLSTLGFFDPQKIVPTPQPNIQDGTVDIGWDVTEKPSDKLELSAGWGGYYGLTGTIGMSFNNFSVRNLFRKRKYWGGPLPSGDGQTLSVRLQSNGKYYSSFNFSFTEPWLGGKKRNPFTVTYYHNKFSNPVGYQGWVPIFGDSSYLKTTGVSVAYGKQLAWPDDFFSLTFQGSYERFKLKNYNRDPIFTPSGLTTGVSNNIYLRITLDRNSTDRPLFPTSGSHFQFMGQFTPPYSLFNPDKDYKNLTPQERFHFIEYQKYKLLAEWYFPIGKPMGKDHKTFVLKASIKAGLIGRYNPKVPLSPFERFEVGGDGISNYIYYGKDIVSQRGYPVYYTTDPKVSPDNQNPPPGYQGFTMFNKYTLELRYPISLNPNSTIIALTFLEAANGYDGLKNFNPFRLRRSAGIGMRFHLPMFGLLGFDYGIGFDRLRQGAGLKDATKFSFMLGYEPY